MLNLIFLCHHKIQMVHNRDMENDLNLILYQRCVQLNIAQRGNKPKAACPAAPLVN